MSRENKNERGNHGAVKRKYACSTPYEHCTGGGSGNLSAGIRDRVKVHDSPEEAYRCYFRYLRDVKGYSYIGQRMMRKKGEPVTILPRKTKAVALKPGKEGRQMPNNRHSQGGFVR